MWKVPDWRKPCAHLPCQGLPAPLSACGLFPQERSWLDEVSVSLGAALTQWGLGVDASLALRWDDSGTASPPRFPVDGAPVVPPCGNWLRNVPSVTLSPSPLPPEFPGVTFQVNHLPQNLCLRVCLPGSQTMDTGLRLDTGHTR